MWTCGIDIATQQPTPATSKSACSTPGEAGIGAREAGARISLVLMMTVVGMAIGGWMSGEIFDLTGSYQAAFANGIAWNLVNIAVAFWLLIGRLWPKQAAA